MSCHLTSLQACPPACLQVAARPAVQPVFTRYSTPPPPHPRTSHASCCCAPASALHIRIRLLRKYPHQPAAKSTVGWQSVRTSWHSCSFFSFILEQPPRPGPASFLCICPPSLCLSLFLSSFPDVDWLETFLSYGPRCCLCAITGRLVSYNDK